MRFDELAGLLPRLRFNSDDIALWPIELLFWLVVLIVTALMVRFRPRFVVGIERRLRPIARRRTACVVGIILAVITIRLALLPVIPVPIPVVHDECSFLLGGDTFASGRLTNPPHPMWQHLETFHVNVKPTYQSMYPPSQFVFLAIGQHLGNPWYGVLISVALMCGAICWMLQGWMPATWALMGGIFCVLRFGIFSYWTNSYFGGAIAAMGGALLLGAYARIRKHPGIGNSLVFALGLALLANSRTLEGAVFSLPPVIALLWWIARSPNRRLLFRNLVAPVLLAMLVVFGWMGYYNWRATGNALLFPYQLNHRNYHYSKPFIGQTALPLHDYAHPEMRRFYLFHEMPDYLASRHLWGVEELSITKVKAYYAYYCWPVLLLIVPSLWRAFTPRRKDLMVVAFSAGLTICIVFAELWPPNPHYPAPIAGAMLLLTLSGLRDLRCWRPRFLKLPVGRWAARATVTVLLLWMVSPIASAILDPHDMQKFEKAGISYDIEYARLLAHLDRMPGKHLVIVEYPMRDVPGVDWVFNRADIDGSKVVWARDMGYDKNQELIRYFSDRHCWIVNRGEPEHWLHPCDSVLPPGQAVMMSAQGTEPR